MDCTGKSFKGQKKRDWITDIHHGIMGDGNIRVLCHKQHFPEIYEMLEDDTIQKVNIKSLPEFHGKEEIPDYHWGKVSFEYKGYKFCFRSGKPNVAEMTEPGDTHWRCEYDYEFGAGFED